MRVKHNMKISYAQLVSQERLMSYVHEMVTKKSNLYLYLIQQQKLVTKVHVKLIKKERLHVYIIPQHELNPMSRTFFKKVCRYFLNCDIVCIIKF